MRACDALSAELRPAEIKRGHQLLKERSERCDRGSCVCRVTIYRSYFGITDGEGPGLKEERIGDARVFVLPNRAADASSLVSGQLIWFERLREFAEADSD